jgi:thioesterase DpgC
MTSFDELLSAWLANRPLFIGRPHADVRLLSRYIGEGEVLLEHLPAKPARTSEQLAHSFQVHNANRDARSRFLDMHVDWAYRALTCNLTVRKSLLEVATEAAQTFPGLVPSSAQMARERSQIQADKEGREIDQGLFFSYVLRHFELGRHLVESALRPTIRALKLLDEFRRNTRLDLGSVLIERRGRAAHIVLNNGHCLNAEDDDLVEDLETAVDLTLLDTAVSVGVLRGGTMTHPRYLGRRVFSAGINLKALNKGRISFIEFLLRRELGLINKILRGLVDTGDERIWHSGEVGGRIAKPWIAAIDGFAIGGGAQMLLVFDHVIAAKDSYFILPAAQEGIVPGFANLRLQRHVGSRKVRQAILLGRKIWAYESDATLVFDEVVDCAEMDSAIQRGIEQLSRPGVVANRKMLTLAEEPLIAFLEYAAEFSIMQAQRIYSQDVIEKVRASTSS